MKIRIPLILVIITLFFQLSSQAKPRDYSGAFRHPQQSAAPAPQQPARPPLLPPDEFILESYFHIEKQGDVIVMQPLLCPLFKLEVLEGDGIVPDRVSKCKIFKRVVKMPTETEEGLFFTILSCPNGNVFGLSEVDFQKDNP